MTVPDDMTEEKWLAETKDAAPGWKPGSVECGGEHGPAFGWTKGNFGIFEGNSQTNAGWLELTSLTHLRSGMRIALFSRPDVAATAGDLAERVGDWSGIDARGLFSNDWKTRVKEMYALWHAAGMQCGPIAVLATDSGIWCDPEPMARQ